MPRTAAKPCMSVYVLNHMSNILHPMCAAPAAKLIGEILLPEVRHRIHVRHAHLCRLLRMRIPQQRQRLQRGFHLFRHALRHRLAPRQFYPRLPYGSLINAAVIANIADMLCIKSRFIREKSCNRIAEQRCIVGIVRLINSFNEFMHRFLRQHIDIIRLGICACKRR